MKHYSFQCDYCGYEWKQSFFLSIKADDILECCHCGDENISYRHYEKVDYYAAPPAKSREKKKK